MAQGKQTCRILKKIRRQIAEANGIEFVTSECRYKGDCFGTCPKCEAEVRYLEQQLGTRRRAGHNVMLAGISAGMILMASCSGTSSRQPNDGLLYEAITTTDSLETEDCKVEELEGDIAAIEDSTTTIIKKTVGEISSVPIIGKVAGSGKEDETVEAVVDVRPTFPGGDGKFMEWISQHLVYPPTAIDKDLQGRVIIRFFIEADGTVSAAEVTRGIDEELDKEALRVIKALPRFNPARLDGKAVGYWFTIPIMFRLTE
ncbi:energy transducer TonB [uncultured Bacteroides sp.]|uniref:energy transducer TonB n=1 Tax=uncultured Bacteroides sp. TaxID=162156 RepID=UPI0026084F21|nr:energy transducer TonB [uncultured Bacteroides sp.]